MVLQYWFVFDHGEEACNAWRTSSSHFMRPERRYIHCFVLLKYEEYYSRCDHLRCRGHAILQVLKEWKLSLQCPQGYHLHLSSDREGGTFIVQCRLFIVCFHTYLLNHEFLFQMPLFLFLVEVPGGLGDSESSFSENKGARPWVVTSMASLQLLSWFMIYKCFFCFSFAGGCGLLWISSHRSWTCLSGAPLKSRTSKLYISCGIA